MAVSEVEETATIWVGPSWGWWWPSWRCAVLPWPASWEWWEVVGVEDEVAETDDVAVVWPVFGCLLPSTASAGEQDGEDDHDQ